MIKRIIFLVIFAALAVALATRPAFQTVAAGVAIFLFGMLFMEQGFKSITSGVLKGMLARVTGSMFRSQVFGFCATALMQSSSLVTVITISTLTAGLITLSAGIGIIYGSNIGTTTGAWIMAGFGLKVDIAQYAMPLIVLGTILGFQKSKTLKAFGNILAGIGFVFLGIHYMKQGFEVFSGSMDLSKYAMPGLAGLLVYTLIGIVMTVIMQSSHATLMITIAALAAGQVTYDNALALAIGSNVGTTVTALIGSLSADVQGKRLAWAHVLFNVITGVIAIVFIVPFKGAVEGVSNFAGIAPDNWTLRLATFHTLFNVLGVTLMTPLTGRLVRMLEKRVRPKPALQQEGVALEPLYLNEAALEVPDAAIEALIRETRHLFDNIFEVVAHGMNLHRQDILSDRDLGEVVRNARNIIDIDVTARYYKSIKSLYSAIVEFATRASASSNMDEQQVSRAHAVRLACRDAAEIVKLVSQLRPNISRNTAGDGSPVGEQYNALRLMIAECLRTLFRLRDADDAQVIEQTLEGLDAKARQQDALANGTIDRLIRQGAISATAATSLMNDSDSAGEIAQRLTELARYMAIARGLRQPGPLDAGFGEAGAAGGVADASQTAA